MKNKNKQKKNIVFCHYCHFVNLSLLCYKWVIFLILIWILFPLPLLSSQFESDFFSLIIRFCFHLFPQFFLSLLWLRLMQCRSGTSPWEVCINKLLLLMLEIDITSYRLSSSFEGTDWAPGSLKLFNKYSKYLERDVKVFVKAAVNVRYPISRL